MKNFKHLLLLISAVMFFGATTAFAATNDYAHRWTFDEGIGRSVGDLVGGQNGVLTGTSTGFGWTSGMIGAGLGMDGLLGESVVLPDGFLSGSQGSIALWFKMNTLSGRNVLFSTRSTINNYIYAALTVEFEGRPQLQFRTTQDGADQKVQGARVLNKNEWYQLVFTGNSQTYRIFINGEEFAVAGNNTGRWFPELVQHVLAYRIGALESNPLSGVFDGYIDDVRIYKRALTQSDVTELYNGGNPGTPAVPVILRPTLTLSVSSPTVPFGGSVTINWSSSKVDSCTANGDWSGDVGTSGSRSFEKLASSATYALSCSGKNGTIAESVQVTVLEKGKTVAVNTVGSGTLSVIETTQGGTTPPPATTPPASLWTRNLSVGLRGDDVRNFQNLLIGKGYLGAEFATGYFGALTKAAAIKLQKELGLPQTGFIGPMTRAKLQAL